jgi:hypothetical protein
MSRKDSLAAALARQLASNRSVSGHEDHFAGHRLRLTHEICLRAPEGGDGRLCLLGIGNANDIDLGLLAERFREIHLVDVDREAVAQAVARLSDLHRGRMVIHAPLDASGIFDRLDEWSRTPPTSGVIAQQIEAAPARVAAALPGPFDVVVSCCLLTQLQLVLLEVVGDRHPSFDELRTAVGAIHVRALAALLAPGGIALLVTDLTANNTYPLDELPPEADLGALMADLLAAGNVIHAAHPGRLSGEIRRDAALRTRYAVGHPVVGPWLWRNGPEWIYLVYALEITARRADDSAAAPA